jgi:hypothetical protein
LAISCPGLSSRHQPRRAQFRVARPIDHDRYAAGRIASTVDRPKCSARSGWRVSSSFNHAVPEYRSPVELLQQRTMH